MSNFKFGSGTARDPQLISQPFPRAKAIKNIQDFQSMLSTGKLGPIATPIGAMKGFFVDAESLNAVLSVDGVAGISFYIGKHPDFPGTVDPTLSIYFVAALKNENAPPKYDNPGDVYEYVDPCPTACGNLV